MNRKKVVTGLCAVLALVAIGIPLQQKMRQFQLDSDLRQAIRQAKPEQVKALLAQGADPNAIGPANGSAESWRKQIDKFLGKSQASESASPLGLATGMNLSGDISISAHWNPVVISTLLSHGAILNPTDPRHPWGSLIGWTLDNSGFGMAYSYRPPYVGCPMGRGHIGFEKRRGEIIISTFRKAGLKGG